MIWISRFEIVESMSEPFSRFCLHFLQLIPSLPVCLPTCGWMFLEFYKFWLVRVKVQWMVVFITVGGATRFTASTHLYVCNTVNDTLPKRERGFLDEVDNQRVTKMKLMTKSKPEAPSEKKIKCTKKWGQVVIKFDLKKVHLDSNRTGKERGGQFYQEFIQIENDIEIRNNDFKCFLKITCGGDRLDIIKSELGSKNI